MSVAYGMYSTDNTTISTLMNNGSYTGSTAGSTGGNGIEKLTGSVVKVDGNDLYPKNGISIAGKSVDLFIFYIRLLRFLRLSH